MPNFNPTKKNLLLAAAEEGAVNWETLARELVAEISEDQAEDCYDMLELDEIF